MIATVAISLASPALTACGGGGGGGGSAKGDTARFDLGGVVISVTENATATIHVDGAPPMDFSGPLGCRGRYFSTEYPEGVQLDFRYSAHDAYLLTGGALYHMGAPSRTAGLLRWSENLAGTKLGVTVDCPLPPGALPPVSSTAPPTACSLLTRALAIQTLGRGVGPAERLKEGRFDTTCTYKTAQLDIASLHVLDATTIESEPLWHYPAVSGLGVPAHAAPAPDGLVAVKGGVGIEVTIGLGASDQAASTAAEVRLARQVLAKLRG